MTAYDIIGAIAFILFISIFTTVFDVLLGDAPMHIQPLIPSDKNPEIIGDGAWIEKPKSALIRNMPRAEI